MRVKLTGPREGQTVTLNGVRFINGEAAMSAAQLRYFAKCYGAVPYGSGDNAAENAAVRAEVQGGPDVRQDGDGAPQEGPHDGAGDDDGDGGEAEQLPGGDGHGHSGVHGTTEGLREAVARLDPENDKMWTTDGRPRVNALAKLLGRMVTKEEVEATFAAGERAKHGG